jgi:L-iditol 2-dehydrogenase
MQDLDEDVLHIQEAMGAEIDVSFDCAGFSKTMSTALNATGAGGKVCLVGMGHNEMTVPLTSAAARYNLCFPQFICSFVNSYRR